MIPKFLPEKFLPLTVIHSPFGLRLRVLDTVTLA